MKKLIGMKQMKREVLAAQFGFGRFVGLSEQFITSSDTW
jgi:hypothetical protein